MSSLRLAIKQSLNESVQSQRPQKDRRRRDRSERRRCRRDHISHYERDTIPSEPNESYFRRRRRDCDALRAQREQFARYSGGNDAGDDISTVGNSSETERDSDSDRETDNSSFTQSDMSDGERENERQFESGNNSVSSEENEANFDDDHLSCTEMSTSSCGRNRGGMLVSAENGSECSQSMQSPLHTSTVSEVPHQMDSSNPYPVEPSLDSIPSKKNKKKRKKKLKTRNAEHFTSNSTDMHVSCNSESHENVESEPCVSQPQHSYTHVQNDDSTRYSASVETPKETVEDHCPGQQMTPISCGEDNGLRKKKKKKRKPSSVSPPSEYVLSWIRNMSQNRQRRKMQTGLRVKVQFDMSSGQNQSEKKKKRIRWYGGLVTDIRAGGRSINILYDDGTSEYANFPDDDIIVDAVENGVHDESTGGSTYGLNPFIPPPPDHGDLSSDRKVDESKEGEELDGHVEEKKHRIDVDYRTELSSFEKQAAVVSDEAVHTERKKKRKEGRVGRVDGTICLKPGDAHLVQDGIVSSNRRISSLSSISGSQDTTGQLHESAESSRHDSSIAKQQCSDVSGSTMEEPRKPSKSRSPKSIIRSMTDDRTQPTEGMEYQRVDASYDSNGCDDAKGTGRVVTTDGEDATSLHSIPRLPGVRRKRPKVKKRRRDRLNEHGLNRQGGNSGNSFEEAFRRKQHHESDEEHCSVPEFVGGNVAVNGMSHAVDVISASCSGESGASSMKSTMHDSSVSSPQHGRQRTHPERLNERSKGVRKGKKKLKVKEKDRHNAIFKSPRTGSSVEASVAAHDTSGMKRKRSTIPREVSPTHCSKRERLDSSISHNQLSAPVSRSNLNSSTSTAFQKKLNTNFGNVEIATTEKSSTEQLKGCTTDDSDSSCDEMEIVSSMSGSRRRDRVFQNKEGRRRSPRSRSVSPVPCDSRSAFDSDENMSFYDSLMYRSSRRAAQKANERIAAKEDVVVDAYGTSSKKQRKEQQENSSKKQTNVRSHQHLSSEDGGAYEASECDDGEKESNDDSDDEEEVSADSQEQNWVQCDRCMKWRLLPQTLSMDELPDRWYCELNVYDAKRRSCDAPEQTADEVLQEGEQDADDNSSRSVKELKERGGKKKRRKNFDRREGGHRVGEITVTHEKKSCSSASAADSEAGETSTKGRKVGLGHSKDSSALAEFKLAHGKHAAPMSVTSKGKLQRVSSDPGLEKRARPASKISDVSSAVSLGKIVDRVKPKSSDVSEVVMSSVENVESFGKKLYADNSERLSNVSQVSKARKKDGQGGELHGKKDESTLSSLGSVREKKHLKVGSISAPAGGVQPPNVVRSAGDDKSDEVLPHKSTKSASRHKGNRKKEKETPGGGEGGHATKASSKQKHDQKSGSCSSSKHEHRGNTFAKNDHKSGSKSEFRGGSSTKHEQKPGSSTKHDQKGGASMKHEQKGGLSTKHENKCGSSTKHDHKADTKQDEKPSLGENQQEWVQCEKCDKWRRLPPRIRAADLPDVWYCSMNTWDPRSATCAAAEDKPDVGAREYTILGQDSQGRARAVSSNAASGSSSTASNKVSYRNLIFGNGRKHNRHGSERARAVDSLFVDPTTLHGTYDADGERCVPTVLYAHSSSFVPRSSNRASEERPKEDQTSVLDLMSRSRLWKELQRSCPGSVESDHFAVGSLLSLSTGGVPKPNAVSDSMKNLVYHVLGAETMEAHEILMEAQCRNWNGEEGVKEEWAELRASCTMEIVSLALDRLIEDGLVETVSEDPQQAKMFRRSCSASVSLAARSGTTRMSRCVKLVKPWKTAVNSGKHCHWSDADECEELLQRAHQRFHALADRMGPDPIHLT